MPLYAYWCKDCEKVFEFLVPYKQRDIVLPCPKCTKDLEKLLSSPSFIIR
jgi:putative FmdB family regulatory protein